ncbi:hypothetical protein RhiirA1_522393 [Rhizophagus irregularis]|uniref:Uncharacterized protein n=1 Tax=Rhizophagus irregularis TaxID=588596 RepID=A0A2N0RG41_9GLOM|nr:hypothetical protein RhiirA1_522393 [Rhizophagus irregularis]
MVVLKQKSSYKSETRKKKILICLIESDDLSEAEDDGIEDAIIDADAESDAEGLDGDEQMSASDYEKHRQRYNNSPIKVYNYQYNKCLKAIEQEIQPFNKGNLEDKLLKKSFKCSAFPKNESKQGQEDKRSVGSTKVLDESFVWCTQSKASRFMHYNETIGKLHNKRPKAQKTNGVYKDYEEYPYKKLRKALQDNSNIDLELNEGIVEEGKSKLRWCEVCEVCNREGHNARTCSNKKRLN